MARYNFNAWPMVQLVLRSGVLATAIGTLATYAHMAVVYNHPVEYNGALVKVKVHGATIALATVTIPIYLWELIALIDTSRHIKRFPARIFGIFDFLLGLWGIFAIVFDAYAATVVSGVGLQVTKPTLPLEVTGAAWLTALVAELWVISVVIGVTSCFLSRRENFLVGRQTVISNGQKDLVDLELVEYEDEFSHHNRGRPQLAQPAAPEYQSAETTGLPNYEGTESASAAAPAAAVAPTHEHAELPATSVRPKNDDPESGRGPAPTGA